MNLRLTIPTSLAAATAIGALALAGAFQTASSKAAATPTESLAVLARTATAADALPALPAQVTARLATFGVASGTVRRIGTVAGVSRWVVAGHDAACVVSVPANDPVVSAEWGCDDGLSVGPRGGLVDLEPHGGAGALLQVVALPGFSAVTIGATTLPLSTDGTFFGVIPAADVTTPVATLSGPAGTVVTPLPPLNAGPVPPAKRTVP